jgi:4-hydroxybenzoate polyprenyltransferase
MPSPRDILRLARPGDWTKNSFVLLAFVFWLANTNPPHTPEQVSAKLTAALVAFASFCLVASGFYSINDAIDAEKDRGHPVKCRRPVASGAISQRAAVVIGVILVSAAIAAAASVSKALAATVIAYALLQVAYNARLKRVAFIDVMTIATGFALRAGAGALAIEVQVSVWLLLCVFFLCMYLGFIKRMCDLVSAERAGSAWKSPAGYRGREEIQWLLGVSAVITTIAYLSYTMSDHTWKIFGARATGLALLTPLVLAAIHRFWRRANEGSSDSPLDALRSDPVVFATITIYGALLGVVLFVPAAKDMLERVFLQHYG